MDAGNQGAAGWNTSVPWAGSGVFLLACLSPGPVWVVITSIAVSRKAGILTSLGVAGTTLTRATVAILGLGLLLAQLAWLSSIIWLAGAAYLTHMDRGADDCHRAPRRCP
jgi:threonine/homoserine/homoserine lactone efflux protein